MNSIGKLITKKDFENENFISSYLELYEIENVNVGAEKEKIVFDSTRWSFVLAHLSLLTQFVSIENKSILAITNFNDPLSRWATNNKANVISVNHVEKASENKVNLNSKGSTRFQIQLDPNFAHIPFADNTFDSIYCLGVIEHTSNIMEANLFLSELARVVKPTGFVFTTTQVTLRGPSDLDSWSGDISPYRIEEFIEVIKEQHSFETLSLGDSLITYDFESHRKFNLPDRSIITESIEGFLCCNFALLLKPTKAKTNVSKNNQSRKKRVPNPENSYHVSRNVNLQSDVSVKQSFLNFIYSCAKVNIHISPRAPRMFIRVFGKFAILAITFFARLLRRVM